MNGQTILCFACALIAAFSTVSDGLAVGFEVDTPLDPFLGGLTKLKRNLLRRLRGVDAFEPANPSFFFGQPSASISLPLADQLSQLSSQTSQLSPTGLDQRKLGIGQLPLHVAQQFDAQLASLAQKKGSPYRSLFGVGPNPNFLQQFGQSNVPAHYGNLFPNI